MSTVNQIWKNLPLGVKGIILLGSGYLIYKSVNKIIAKTSFNADTRDVNQEVQGWNQQNQKDSRKVKPTMSMAALKSLSNKIFTAMDGYGTRDTQIESAFMQLKNNADFSGLMAAFGRRDISSGYLNPIPNLKNASLIQALNDELSSGVLADINKELNKKGITYTV